MTRHLVRAALAALPLLAGLTAIDPASAQVPAQRVRGTIERVDEGGIRVRSREGEELVIALAPDARVNTLKRVELGSVAPGAYIGTAAMPPSGREPGARVKRSVGPRPRPRRGGAGGRRDDPAALRRPRARAPGPSRA